MSNKPKVGYLGPVGSFSDQALLEYFGNTVTPVECKFFEDIFLKMKEDIIDFGILPIENTSTGGIIEIYDLLRKNECYIIGEQSIKIEHNLLSIKGATTDQIRKVYSHPQPYYQSKDFFVNQSLMEFVPLSSTAESAKFVSEQNDPTIACIGSKRAAEIYHLNILNKNINFSHQNYTRFAVVSKKAARDPKADKVSLIYTLPHKAGSLYQSLGYFANHHINMLKIESRPIIGKSWEYFFYIDIEGNLNDPNIQEALLELTSIVTYIRMLGNYKADTTFSVGDEHEK